MLVRILGIHAVDEAPDPCHLIELALHDGDGPADGFVPTSVDATAITQVVEGEARDAWQTPMDLHRLDGAGASGTPVEGFAARAVALPARLAFFFHFLHLDRPLLTPAGPALLPAPTPRPTRLAFMIYR